MPRAWRENDDKQSTIVCYSDIQIPINEFPTRIISPSHSGPCCLRAMTLLEPEIRDHVAVYQYKRCARCGYTVRHVSQVLPNEAAMADLRKAISRSFKRAHGWST